MVERKSFHLYFFRCALGIDHEYEFILTGSWGLGPVAAGGPELDVQSGDAKGLELLRDVLGGQHGGVGRGLVTVGLDLHATGHTAQGLPGRGQKTW